MPTTTPATAKRVQYHRYGGPDVLRFEDFEPPAPGPGEVLVRVRAAGANPMDRKIREGEMKMITGRDFPMGVGYDFAGVVAAVGPGVTRLAAGDEVLGGAPLKRGGAFAELVLAEETGVVRKPAGLSFEDAAVLPTVGLTAYQALFTKARLGPGQAVFVHGCLGGVGRAALQLAAAHGISLAGSCRPTAADEARALGADPVVGFTFDPAPLRGRFDLVLDTAGTLPYKAARTLLRPGGRIVDINPTPAKLARGALPGPYQVLIAKAVTEDLDAVARAAGEGALRLPIGGRVALPEAVAALTARERDTAPGSGKFVVTVE
ncbi:NADPH:quinone reductase [Actinacidiphila alni]|uniref:NADPH:quinone reductase n=1 Tax=Actinacidiphila alni TaxID=380248 RepID=A0A1I1YJK9_9ACTN|nr:NADP-dependent oxidoreductase [Actinacidiphila alni]SFE18333.1 NADPH:quinone reductase [Actinacidiphila alni]